MIKKILARIAGIAGLLLLLIFGVVNAQTRNLTTPNTQSSRILTPVYSDFSREMKVAEGNPLELMKGKAEDVSKRTMDSKHFRNADGSFTAIIGAGPMHYEKSGNWEEISTDIITTNDLQYRFQNSTNLMETQFGSNSKLGIKSKTKEGEVLEFQNVRMYWEVKGISTSIQNAKEVQAKLIDDKIIYENIFNSIDAEYSVRIGQRKLNFIIPNKNVFTDAPKDADFLVFEEQIILPKNWRVKKVNNGGIDIIDLENLVIYNYPKPEVFEKYEGSDILPTLTTQPFFETEFENGIFILRIKVKADWLLSDDRIFPLAIDPTATVYPNNTARWTKSVYSNGTEVATALYFGYQSAMFLNGHIRFNTSSIANGSIINSATGWINITAGTGTSPATRQWQFANSANPVTTTGVTLFNSANLGYSQIVSVTGTGWRSSSLYNPEGNIYVENSLVNNAVNLAIVPSGTYTNGTYMTVANYSSTNRPYLVINYFHALNVSNAYTGASHADGRHGYDTNTAVTITSGTRAGYVCTGWIGTGSVPATGTTNSVTISMTQNSSINWQWQIQPGNPNNINFYNYGGTEQLAFNNSRSNTTTPLFRLSHQTDPATDYQIEINTLPNFSGTAWNQTFTGTFPLNTEANFTFNNGFTPTNNTTYYVRARVRGAANVWSAWTTQTYSFTYETPKSVPDWFQTMQAQYQTNALVGVEANASNNVVTLPGGNIVQNGSFENGMTNWTISKPNWYTVASEPYGNTAGTNALNIYNTNPGSFGNFGGDNAGAYQNVDMTGVTTLYADFGYESTAGSSLLVNMEIWISDTSQTSLRTGTKVLDWRPTANVSLANPFTIDLSSYAFTGNKLIKIVAYHAISSIDYAERYFYIDNVQLIKPPFGTITSTPIHLASVQDVTAYQGIIWNQTLGGGTLTLKVQQSVDGISGWTDVTGYTNITQTGDGLKTADLSAMTAYPHIRLVGTLNGQNVQLHDWSVQFTKPGCHTTTTWNGTAWSHGEPDALNKKIIFTGNYNSATDPNNSGNLVGCSLEILNNSEVIIAPDHNVELDNEIKVETGSTFNLKSDANLIQNNIDVENEGVIKVERNSKMKRLDYIYWGAPVTGQTFLSFSPNTVASRFYRYNEQFDSFITISNLNDTMVAGEGYAIRAPNNQNATTPSNWTGIFVGKPNNGNITIPVTKHPDSPLDPNDMSSPIVSRGKNMLANPYPSNLDLEALSDANPATSSGVYYFWTNTDDFLDNTQVPGNGQYGNYASNHYATYNSTGAVPAANAVNGQLPTRYIRPGQGFLFEAQNSGTVVFNNGMRSTNSNSNFISNKESGISPERFWLKLTTPIGNTNTLLIAYLPGATNGFEPRFDARFPQRTPDRFYTVVGTEELIIQGRQYPFAKTDIVHLGMANFAAGTYKIEIADKEGIFSAGQTIYLKDKQNGIIANLSQGSYTFHAEAGEINSRFEILYQAETILVTDGAVKGSLIVYRDATDFVVKSTDKPLLEIQLYDAVGKLIRKVNANNAKEVRLDAVALHPGMYILKVLHKDGVATKKIIKY